MVRGGERFQGAMFKPSGKRRIARLARPGLNVACAEFDLQHGMFDAERLAQLRHLRCLGGIFSTQAMIDGRCLDPPGQRAAGQQQQCQTVGTARNSKAQPS